jgi:hypothetical protein
VARIIPAQMEGISNSFDSDVQDNAINEHAHHIEILVLTPNRNRQEGAVQVFTEVQPSQIKLESRADKKSMKLNQNGLEYCFIYDKFIKNVL